jgi:hypothetical protein
MWKYSPQCSNFKHSPNLVRLFCGNNLKASGPSEKDGQNREEILDLIEAAIALRNRHPDR